MVIALRTKKGKMKITLVLVASLVLFGFIMPGDSCKKAEAAMENPAGSPDGPYVLYRNGFVHTMYIRDRGGEMSVIADSVVLADKSNIKLKVRTDRPAKTFTVKLKDHLVNENTEYPGVKKMFIVSDIEGSFKAFRKLLQSNKIINDDYEWTFGDGHLVLTGDFVDRGDLVTEVLWLIYSLEEKAKAAGGYVHFILGNHEIMNMNGDLRYLNSKYVNNAALLNTDFIELYGDNAELGRWFRTKNVAEKIGDILFVHGGISGLVNGMNISAPEINQLVRPHYADTSYTYPPRVDTLFSDFGPFWYRGYYVGARAGQTQIDSTLEKFGVKHIATGHTVISDTISVLYGGKVFNTDVYHSKGISEGLFFENGNFYRATPQGEKFLIWRKN